MVTHQLTAVETLYTEVVVVIDVGLLLFTVIGKLVWLTREWFDQLSEENVGVHLNSACPGLES